MKKPALVRGLSRVRPGLGRKYPKFLVSRDNAIIASGFLQVSLHHASVSEVFAK
jgi:hypothetical protein